MLDLFMPVNISIVEGDVTLLSILSQAIDSSPEFKCMGRYLTPDAAVSELVVTSPNESKRPVNCPDQMARKLTAE